jgi:DNA-binding NarL/FixJ family response regulator
MVKIFLADNQPVVHYGLGAFLKNSTSIKLVEGVSNFNDLLSILKNKSINVLVVDLELEGLSSINLLMKLKKDYESLKILIYTNLSENLYAPNIIKAGAAAFVHKTESLDFLTTTIERVAAGEIVFNEIVKQKLNLIAKQNKNNRNYRKLSLRELEVLRYLIDGKKNNEISKILNLNEKTISTYKLRLLTKLNVTNLVDLVNKAKTLDVI